MTKNDHLEPTYNVCFKTGDYFKECGVAWEQKAKSGRKTIRIKLDSIPLQFDGKLTLLERGGSNDE